MRRWEIEIRNLADDFGLDKKDVDDAVKRQRGYLSESMSLMQHGGMNVQDVF